MKNQAVWSGEGVSTFQSQLDPLKRVIFLSLLITKSAPIKCTYLQPFSSLLPTDFSILPPTDRG